MEYRRITFRELVEMFQSLPSDILDKKIGYLDLAHITPEDLEDFKSRLLQQKGDYIEQCCN